MRTLFVPGLVLLLLGYQVLSAMGSQVVDFLLFDRAAAQYSGDDLTRFLSTYTAVLNLADILFLALLAGPLLRRFGLRLGLTFNPAVVAGILAVMAVVTAAAGSASFALLVLASILRIGDIAATDGTTRTSINAAYQIVPAAGATRGAVRRRGHRRPGSRSAPPACCSSSCPPSISGSAP